MSKELILLEIFALPKDGPTLASWIISVLAGSLPTSSMLAKSIASSTVKLPVMEEDP
jgi:hypothetical protein